MGRVLVIGAGGVSTVAVKSDECGCLHGYHGS